MLMQTATATTRPDQKSQVAVERLSFRQLAYACWEQEHFDRVKGAALLLRSLNAQQTSEAIELACQVTIAELARDETRNVTKAVTDSCPGSTHRAANSPGLATSVSRVSPHIRPRTARFRTNEELDRTHIYGIKIRELRRRDLVDAISRRDSAIKTNSRALERDKALLKLVKEGKSLGQSCSDSEIMAVLEKYA